MLRFDRVGNLPTPETKAAFCVRFMGLAMVLAAGAPEERVQLVGKLGQLWADARRLLSSVHRNCPEDEDYTLADSLHDAVRFALRTLSPEIRCHLVEEEYAARIPGVASTANKERS